MKLTPMLQRPTTAVRRQGQIIVPNNAWILLSETYIYPMEGPLFEVVLTGAQQCAPVEFPHAEYNKSYRMYVDIDGVGYYWDYTMVNHSDKPDNVPFFSANTDVAPAAPVTLSNWYLREIIAGPKPPPWRKPPDYCGYDA